MLNFWIATLMRKDVIIVIIHCLFFLSLSPSIPCPCAYTPRTIKIFHERRRRRVVEQASEKISAIIHAWAIKNNWFPFFSLAQHREARKKGEMKRILTTMIAYINFKTISIHVCKLRDESRSISSHNCMFVWLEKLFNGSILKSVRWRGEGFGSHKCLY